jgi:hypothetical protein
MISLCCVGNTGQRLECLGRVTRHTTGVGRGVRRHARRDRLHASPTPPVETRRGERLLAWSDRHRWHQGSAQY